MRKCCVLLSALWVMSGYVTAAPAIPDETAVSAEAPQTGPDLTAFSDMSPGHEQMSGRAPVSGLLVTTLPRKARLEIRLVSDQILPFKYKASGNKLTLNLNAPLNAQELTELPSTSHGWISQVTAGGGSTYHLTGRKNTSFDVRQKGRTIFVNVLQSMDESVPHLPEMVIDDTPARAELTLLWPDDAKVQVEESDGLYVFSLGRPLKNEKIGTLAEMMPRWVSESSNYFDNFSLRPVENISLNVTQMGPQIILNFNYAEKHVDLEKPTTPTPSTPDIRMSRYKGQTLLTSERDFEARSQFSEIVGKTKENLDAMRWLGDTEAHIKRWRRAIMVYDHLFSLDPQETGVAFRKAFLYHENGNYCQFDPEWYHVEGQETTTLGRFSGRYILGTHAHIEGSFENRHLCSAETNDCSGNVSIFTGHRMQGFGAFVYHFDSLDKLHLGLYGAYKNFGGAGAYTFGWKHSETRLGLNYHTTDWNYVQQIVGGGNIDSVSIKHEHRLLEDRVFVDGLLGYNRYNLDCKDDLGRTTRANATVNVIICTKEDPSLSIGYGYAAEYVHDVETGLDVNGETFTYIPLVDRETHSLSARSSAYMTDYIFAEGVVGWSFERFSRNHGPILGLSLVYEPISTFSMGIKVSREVLNTRGSNRYLNAALGSVTVRF